LPISPAKIGASDRANMIPKNDFIGTKDRSQA